MILASTVYNSYPDAKALDIDPPEEGEDFQTWYDRIKDDLNDCEDTLFAFIIREIHDAPDAPIRALQMAIRDLEATIAGLQSNGDGNHN